MVVHTPAQVENHTSSQDAHLVGVEKRQDVGSQVHGKQRANTDQEQVTVAFEQGGTQELGIQLGRYQAEAREEQHGDRGHSQPRPVRPDDAVYPAPDIRSRCRHLVYWI